MKTEVLEYFMTDNKSGWKCVRKKLNNNNPDLFNLIEENSKLNDLIDLSFTQQIYHYIYELNCVPICKCCKINFPKFRGLSLGYSVYCSMKCINNDLDVKLKKKEKYIKNHISGNHKHLKGEDNPLAKGNTAYLKRKDTIRDKYGVDNIKQISWVKEKASNTFSKNYGKGTDSSIKLKEKKRKTFIEKTNGKYFHPFQVPEVRLAGIESLKINREEIKKKKLEKTRKRILAQYPNLNIINVDYDRDITILCDKCNTEYIINNNLLQQRVEKYKIETPCLNCNPLSSSICQTEIYEFIKNNTDFNVIQNNRTVISPKELDIYIPELNLAFEYNSFYAHNNVILKNKNYHLNKTVNCIKQKVHLVHIWEDDWLYRKNIIKSRILNLLNKTPNRIYSRKCVIREVSFKESNKFLEDNHLQGKCMSKYNIGLYYGEELVSLMTFGKIRYGNKNKEKYDLELYRFCNKLNTNVIGAANRLFSYFINKYSEINLVLTYSNRDWAFRFDENVYINMGFDYLGESRPGYFYTKNYKRYNRQVYVKHKLSNYSIDKTEFEIMHGLDYKECYNSGNYIFVWKR